MSSNSSLSSYRTELASTPPYTTAHPPASGHRVLHLVDRRSARRLSGQFSKKTNGVSLTLSSQAPTGMPMYGLKAIVEGRIDVMKPESIASAEIKIEGRLRLRETAEGGTKLFPTCFVNAMLWTKDRNPHSWCPSSLPFRLNIPSTFQVGSKTYPLPPTYEAHLESLPGFSADVEYYITAVVTRGNSTSLFGINIGTVTVSTPFIYNPRTRPTAHLPQLMVPSSHGFHETADSEWKSFPSILRARSSAVTDIATALFLPASQIYCMSQVIPFHLLLRAPSAALAAYRPLGPSANPESIRRPTQLRVLRQCLVDVRAAQNVDAKTDIWRVDCIGNGRFQSSSDGSNWIAYTGQIILDKDLTIAGFTAAGLSVKDSVALTITPSDPERSPFTGLRQTVSIHLTTDPWVPLPASAQT